VQRERTGVAGASDDDASPVPRPRGIESSGGLLPTSRPSPSDADDDSQPVTPVAAAQRYDATAIALHWVTAALIVVNLVLGLSMVQLPISPRKLSWYLWHKSIGVTIFALTSLRLSWRALRPPPALLPMPRWQLRATGISHTLLYVLLALIPLSGWLYSSATGVQVVYLGLVPLPDLVPKDKALAGGLRIVHIALNCVLVVTVCIHVAAAIRHHVVGDDVLRRMIPRLRSTTVHR
jgi:cytochrome b561